MAKYVVEKLYKVHRERLGKVKSLTDNRLHVMDFLTNKTWKKTAAYHQELRIMKHNEEMYERIAKVENGESIIAKEKREHVKKVSEGSKVMDRLKRGDRERKILLIQKENEHLHARLQKASAEYTMKKCNEWYKHHELFKKGRRTDVTAGHIMNVPKNLLPKYLPSIHRDMRSEASTFANDYGESTFGDSTRGPSKQSMSAGGSFEGSAVSSSLLDDGSVFVDVPSGTFANPIESRRYRNLTTSKSDTNPDVLQGMKKGHKSNSLGSPLTVDPTEGEEEGSGGQNLFQHSFMSNMGQDVFYEDVNDSVGSFHSKSASTSMLEDQSYYMIAQRQFAIPFEHKNCIIQIFIAESGEDTIYMRVISATAPFTVLTMRSITLDQYFEVVVLLHNMPQAASAIENVSHLRSLLTNMFHEADSDQSGSLSFDEFHALMEKIDLGITSQELRFVISEADENADGVVDYEEFVPIAVDMILAFRARTTARKHMTEAEGTLDEDIHKALRSTPDIERIASVCLEKLIEADPKKTGIMRVNDLRRKLQSISGVGLSALEINMVCQSLPRDQLQRCKYATFKEVLYDVRFVSMKNMIVESRGTFFQNHLLDICKQEEQKIREEVGDDIAVPGMIPFRNLVNMMIKSQVLTLNRLQVMVIVSEAHVVNDMVNYHTFVPTAAKAIEMMFEPNSVRVRSELLENTDLSVSQLLEGESNEDFHARLVALFNVYDIQHTGELDPKQFSNCMQSLELNLTPSEIFALMASADVDHSGTVSFEEFVSFCTHNLLHLEKEKRLRQLQTSEGPKRSTATPDMPCKNNKVFDDMFQGHLLAVFAAADKDSNGVLDAEEIHGLLGSLDVNLTQFQLDVLLSEMDSNDDNRITYAEFVPVCAELLQSFRNRAAAGAVSAVDERAVAKQTMRLCNSEKFELKQISSFVYDKVMMVMQTVQDIDARRVTLKSILHNVMTGLCKSEANMLLAKLCPSEKVMELGFMGKFKKEIDMIDSSTSSQASATPKNTVSNSGAGSPTSSSQGRRRRQNTFRAMNDELATLIRRVRETTIKRSITEPFDVARTEKRLLSALVKEARKINADNSENPHLPVRTCFNVLHHDPHLRLALFQILHIIQFSTCFEIGTTGVNYQQFAEFAANKVGYLTSVQNRQSRGAVVDNLQGTILQFMCGLTEPEFNSYFEERFKTQARGDGLIDEGQLCEIIAGTPKCAFSEAECLAIASAFPRVDENAGDGTGMISCDEFMPWGYSVALTAARERVIGRRLLFMSTLAAARAAKQKFEENGCPKLMAAATSDLSSPSARLENRETNRYIINDTETVYVPLDRSVPLIKELERLLDMTRLVVKDERLTILLPHEKNHSKNSGYLNVQVRNVADGSDQHSMGKSKSSAMAAGRSTRDTTEHDLDDSLLIKCGKFVPIRGAPVGVVLVPIAPGATSTDPAVKYLPSLVTISMTSSAQDKAVTSDGDKGLTVHVYSTYSGNNVCVTLPMPVKLPSVGLVDREAAVQFASNIVDLMSLSYANGKASVQIE